jgi:hypothetical protein
LSDGFADALDRVRTVLHCEARVSAASGDFVALNPGI